MPTDISIYNSNKYPEVNTFADLPSPASDYTGRVYEVINETGTWILGTRKQAGFYRSNGTKWELKNDIKSLLVDNEFNIRDDADNTKGIKFVLNSLTSGILRAFTWQDRDGTVALLDDVNLKQDILAEGAFVDGDKTKLDSIESGATADQVWGEIGGTLSNQTDLQGALNFKADLVGGIIPQSQLPSYVDDVLEFASFASLPVTGELGKIYVTTDNNDIYRWSGSAYLKISDVPTPAEIKTSYESNPDTNAFTDADKTSLNNKVTQGGDSLGTKLTIGTNDANDFAIETNGTEKVSVLSNGNVGIGAINPNTKLEVRGAVGTAIRITTPNVTPTVGDKISSIEMYSEDISGGGVSSVRTSINTVAEDAFGERVGLSFSTTDDAPSSVNVERMRISNAGNVGIGTANTNSKLTVDGDINTNHFLLSKTVTSEPTKTFLGNSPVDLLSFTDKLNALYGLAAGTNTNVVHQQITSGDSNAQSIIISSGGQLANQIRNIQGWDVLSSRDNARNISLNALGGNVGIGELVPQSVLHVTDNSTETGSNVGITIQQNGTGDAVTQYLLPGGRRWVTGIDNSDGDKFKFAPNTDLGTNSVLTLHTDGSVGVGIDEPKAKLHVANGIARISNSFYGNSIELNSEGTGDRNAFIDFHADDATADFAARIIRNLGTNGSFDIRNKGTGSLNLGTNNSTVLSIVNGGNVGIGTSDPKSKLHVIGLPTYADNTSAITGGLTAGALYIRTGHGLDVVV